MAEMEILEIEESTNPNKDSKVFINENGVFKQAEIDNLLRNSDTISDVNTSLNDVGINNIYDNQVKGGYISSTGSFVSDNNYITTTTKYPCAANDSITVKYSENADIRIAYYKSDNTFIARHDNNNVMEMIDTAPTDSAYFYVIICKPLANIKRIVINKNNDISKVKNTLVDNAGAHNGIFTEKFLGTFNTVDEVKKFLSDHKVAEKQYTGLYVGDYLRLNDGVYNKDWVIAGFELYNNKGDSPLTVGNIVLIPKTPLVNKQMNPTNTTEGGYYNSAMHQTHIPEIVANLEKVLGNTLLTRRCLLTNSMSPTLSSMAGAGYTGCSNGWAWYDCKAVLMSEVEIYGTTIFSSSFYDVGEACEKLPIFNFINHVKYSRYFLWLRAVASASYFASADSYGGVNCSNASHSWGVSPIIVVGLI